MLFLLYFEGWLHGYRIPLHSFCLHGSNKKLIVIGMMSFPPFLSFKIFPVCLLISVFVFDKPTCGAFVLFCIYHFWSSLGSLDLGFFYYVLTVLTHYYFKYFFLLCSFILLSLAIHQHIHNISFYCPTIFGCSLLLFFFFHSLCLCISIRASWSSFLHSLAMLRPNFSSAFVLFSSWHWVSLHIFPQRNLCNSFSCNLLSLYLSPDYIVIYCKGKGTFCNFLVLDYHPLVDLCFKVISPVV